MDLSWYASPTTHSGFPLLRGDTTHPLIPSGPGTPQFPLRPFFFQVFRHLCPSLFFTDFGLRAALDFNEGGRPLTLTNEFPGSRLPSANRVVVFFPLFRGLTKLLVAVSLHFSRRVPLPAVEPTPLDRVLFLVWCRPPSFYGREDY